MRHPTLSDLLREVELPPQLHDRLARVAYNLGGGRMPTVFTTTISANLPTNAEAVMMTTPALNPGVDASLVLLAGVCQITAGTSTTALSVRFRQGTTVAGAQVGAGPGLTAVAGTIYELVNLAMDTPGAVAGMQYVMTGTATTASAASATQFGFMMAMAIG